MPNKQTGSNLPGAGPGRPKNSLNKITKVLKDAILLAAEQVGSDGKGKDGLVGYLRTQATEHSGPYLALLGKVLPLEVRGRMETPTVSKEQRDAAVAAALRAELDEYELGDRVYPGDGRVRLGAH